jgi:hypothetical protein
MSIAGGKPADAVIMGAALPLESSKRVIKTKRQTQHCAQVTVYMWYWLAIVNVKAKKQMVKLIGFTAHSAGKRKLAFSGALI